MIKLTKVEQLENLNLEKEVNEVATDYINFLDENYGSNREVEKDLGGYILLIEDKGDLQGKDLNILKGIIPEYSDGISCSNGEEHVLTTFILSSDYVVIVIATEKLTKLLIRR